MRKAFALGVPFVFLAVACTYDNGDAHHILYDNPLPISCTTPIQSSIDTDQALEIDPGGVGAGVFIEYTSGGHYHLRTSCDTTRSNSTCSWDVIITPQDGTTISNVVGENLTGGDSVHVYSDPTQPTAPVSYQLTALTSTEIDGVTFDIDPGAAISVDAFLDDTCALGFFFWVGGGALHQGSPSNPLQLTPTSE